MAKSSKAPVNYSNSLADNTTRTALASIRLALVGDVEFTDENEQINMQLNNWR